MLGSQDLLYDEGRGIYECVFLASLTALSVAHSMQHIPAMNTIRGIPWLQPGPDIRSGLSPALLATAAPAIPAALTGVVWFPTILVQAFLPLPALSFYEGALSLLHRCTALCDAGRTLRGKVDGTGRDGGCSADPQQVSGKRTK